MPRIPVSILSNTLQGTTNPAVPNARSIPVQSNLSRGPAQPLEHFPNRQLNRVQSATMQFAQRTQSRPDADQNAIPNVAFTGGTQVAIKHALGRAWVGCSLNTPIGGYLSYKVAHNSDSRLDAAQILVTCANTCTATVVVW